MAKQIKEEWKDIPGYDGYYEISNTGRTRSKPVRAYDKYGNVFLSLRVHVQRKECSVLIIPTLDVVQMENQKQQAVIYGNT